MIKSKIKLVLISFYWFLCPIILWAQTRNAFNHLVIQEGISFDHSQLIYGSRNLAKPRTFPNSWIKVDSKYNFKQPVRSGSTFNMSELANLVDKCLVYQKKYFSIGIIPPRVRIIIKEKAK